MSNFSLALMSTDPMIAPQPLLQEPSTFSQAWDHNNPTSRHLWREAIKKEFKDISERGVWEVVDKNHHRMIGLRWVFNVKKDGYRGYQFNSVF